MKARITSIPATAWGWIALPVAVVVGPLAVLLLPMIVRAIVPQTVRMMLHLL